MRGRSLVECVYRTAEATAMVFMILLGADVLNVLLALTRMPAKVANLVKESGPPPMLVLSSIRVAHLLLG